VIIRARIFESENMQPIPIPQHFSLACSGGSTERRQKNVNSQLAGDALFGWLHPVRGHGPGRAGVVLCSPLGYEQICTQRFYRHLAEQLAENGFPALRFDYHGTADAAGCDRDSSRLTAWIDSIDTAVRELRSACDVRDIYLFGLRLGASLAAAAAAAERGVNQLNGLILWRPFVKGKDFCREVEMLDKLKAHHPQRGRDALSEGERNFFGFILSSATLMELGELSLDKMSFRNLGRVFILTKGQTDSDLDIIRHLHSLPVQATAEYAPGYAELMQDPHKSTVPAMVVGRIVGWLSDLYPCRGTEEPMRYRGSPKPDCSLHVKGCRQPVSVDQDVVEAPVVFGSRGPLFGILAEPNSSAVAGKPPAVLLVNAGATYHIGPARLYVVLARHWARSGHSVFRFDLSGLGDSPAAPDCNENRVEPRDALRDVIDAMDALEAARGIDSFVLLGLCSGARVAFKAAVADRRAVGVLLLSAFMFPGGGEIPKEREIYKDLLWYKRAIFSKESWMKVLKGKADLDRFGEIIVEKLRELCRLPAARRRSAPQPGSGNAACHHPCDHACSGSADNNSVDTVQKGFLELSKRGIQPMLIYSDNDPELYIFRQTMNHAIKDLGIDLEVMHGADHIFSHSRDQEELGRLLDRYMQKASPGTDLTRRPVI
jgi:alpha-beta hydrolase superfamily lysophospholipase